MGLDETNLEFVSEPLETLDYVRIITTAIAKANELRSKIVRWIWEDESLSVNRKALGEFCSTVDSLYRILRPKWKKEVREIIEKREDEESPIIRELSSVEMFKYYDKLLDAIIEVLDEYNILIPEKHVGVRYAGGEE